MPSTQRINSILTAPCLDQTVTNCLSWKPNALEFDTDPEISIPTNLRLGQQVEKTLIELIKGSRNYSVIHDGVQIKKDGKTIGELDAIIRDEENGQLIHLEIAYKFYLLDPSISSDPIKQWIGPNRNDTLHEKLHKIKRKQFPILKTPEVEEMIGKEITSNCTQALCFMAHLYIPRDSDITMPNNVSHAVVGHYLTFQILVQLDHTSRLYRIPKKPIGVSIQQLVFIGSGLMKFNRHWQRAWMKNARCWFGKRRGMSTQPSLWYGGRYQYIKVCTTFLDLNLTDFSLF